jgi:hypothetical protein
MPYSSLVITGGQKHTHAARAKKEQLESVPPEGRVRLIFLQCFQEMNEFDAVKIF